MDYNGTMACDGSLLEGLPEILSRLKETVDIHVLTADTFGCVKDQLNAVSVRLVIIPAENQAEAKRDYIDALGADSVVAIGNGRNDSLMLKSAGLGIAVIQAEGACCKTVLDADVMCTDIRAALELLVHSKRLVATLRS